MSKSRRLLFFTVLITPSRSPCRRAPTTGERSRPEEAGKPVPWWCHSTEEIPVTEGPAVGTVNWYAGTHKAPLPWGDCVHDVGPVRRG